MSETKFYICERCGNIIEKICDSGVPVVCCGKPMKQPVFGAVDASLEKHVPVVTVEGSTVKVAVGAAEHPMIPEHFIMWVYLQTNVGGQRKVLQSGTAPAATFALAEGEVPVAVYEYCNLHGLWKTDL